MFSLHAAFDIGCQDILVSLFLPLVAEVSGEYTFCFQQSAVADHTSLQGVGLPISGPQKAPRCHLAVGGADRELHISSLYLQTKRKLFKQW